MPKKSVLYMIVFLTGFTPLQAQWSEKDSLYLKKILSGEEEINLNPEFIKKILLEAPAKAIPDLIKPLLSTDKTELNFIEELPSFFNEEPENILPYLTLRPYRSDQKYNDDPVFGENMKEYSWPMATELYSRPYNEQERLYRNAFPFAAKKGNTPNPGEGVGGSFSMNDLLLVIFSKKARAKMRNAKNANAWKTY